MKVVAADADDVVAAVCGGIVDGFVFAHECESDLGGYAAKGAAVGGEV